MKAHSLKLERTYQEITLKLAGENGENEEELCSDGRISSPDVKLGFGH